MTSDDSKNLPAATGASAPSLSDIDTPQVAAVLDLMRAAIDAGQGANIGQLHQIYEREREDARRRAYMAAKLAMMEKMPIITKDGSILNKRREVQSRFSSYPHLKKIVDPILMAHGFVLDHRTGVDAAMKMMTVEAVLQHAPSGHEERGGPLPVPLDTSGGKNATQGAGSSVSYGKRYTTCSILGIVEQGVDTDGNGPVVQTGSLDAMFEDQIAASRKAATGGTGAYEAWFRDQSATVRGYLVDSGTHANNKAAAKEFAPGGP